MSQTTKLSGLAAASILLLSVSSCTEKIAKSDSDATSTQKVESHPSLRSEIQKVLREEKHDSKILTESLRGMTWEDAKPILKEEETKYELEHGKATSKEASLIVGLEIRDALSDIAIEKADKKSKRALEELDRGLKEMAEKEGRMK